MDQASKATQRFVGRQRAACWPLRFDRFAVQPQSAQGSNAPDPDRRASMHQPRGLEPESRSQNQPFQGHRSRDHVGDDVTARSRGSCRLGLDGLVGRSALRHWRSPIALQTIRHTGPWCELHQSAARTGLLAVQFRNGFSSPVSRLGHQLLEATSLKPLRSKRRGSRPPAPLETPSGLMARKVRSIGQWKERSGCEAPIVSARAAHWQPTRASPATQPERGQSRPMGYRGNGGGRPVERVNEFCGSAY